MHVTSILNVCQVSDSFFRSCQGDHFRRIQVCTDHKLHLQHIPRSNHKMLKSCWCHQRCTNGPHTEPQVTREPCAQWRSRCEWCHCLVPHLTGSGSVFTRLWLCARPPYTNEQSIKLQRSYRCLFTGSVWIIVSGIAYRWETTRMVASVQPPC